jgi:hypothetical protein
MTDTETTTPEQQPATEPETPPEEPTQPEGSEGTPTPPPPNKPPSTYTQNDFKQNAANFGATVADVAGIFRATKATKMTEPEFRDALNKWRTTGLG